MVFTWLSKVIGFGFGFGFTMPFGWLVYLLWFWFYDSQVKTALSELSTIPQYFLYVQESRISKPTSHGLKAVICDVGSTKTNVRQVRTTCSILHKMANSSISYLELNHWWHYSECWQHDNRCRLEDRLAPLVQKLRELRYSSFFFYTVGEPGYVVLMRLIIWKSWPTYIVIHCCKMGEYIANLSSCFFQEAIFQILENLMAPSFYIVPEKNVLCSWINYFCYHSSY